VPSELPLESCERLRPQGASFTSFKFNSDDGFYAGIAIRTEDILASLMLQGQGTVSVNQLPLSDWATEEEYFRIYRPAPAAGSLGNLGHLREADRASMVTFGCLRLLRNGHVRSRDGRQDPPRSSGKKLVHGCDILEYLASASVSRSLEIRGLCSRKHLQPRYYSRPQSCLLSPRTEFL
jgi:hypothetical protein